MKRLGAKAVLDALRPRLLERVERVRRLGVSPALTIVLVGTHGPSQVYVRGKARAAAQLGIRVETLALPAEIAQLELERELERLNADVAMHGILCQLPLPPQLDANAVCQRIDPRKDVDCFHPWNFGLLAQGWPRFLPCTPAGVLRLLQHYEVPIAGRRVVLLGRSNIVGRPLSLLLSQKGCDAMVTLCHSRTPQLVQAALQADILIAAVGQVGFVGPEMVRPGAVIVDVGIHRVKDPHAERGYRLCGDVAASALEALPPSEQPAALTPVPGGVGPMTVIMLMENTLRAAERTLEPYNKQ